MVNTESSTYMVKGSTVNGHKQSKPQQVDVDTQKVNFLVSSKAHTDQGHTMSNSGRMQVSTSEFLPMINRFQVLATGQAYQVSGANNFYSDDSYATSVPLKMDSYNKRPKTDQSAKNSDRQMDQISHVSQDLPSPLDLDLSLVPEFQKCKAQIGTEFGCIPLAPIYVYQGPEQYWEQIPYVLNVHRLIRGTGIPNF